MNEKLVTVMFCSKCFHHQVLDIKTIQKLVTALGWKCHNCGHFAFIGGDERAKAVEAYYLIRWQEEKTNDERS